jgi:hypothetical protein
MRADSRFHPSPTHINKGMRLFANLPVTVVVAVDGKCVLINKQDSLRGREQKETWWVGPINIGVVFKGRLVARFSVWVRGWLGSVGWECPCGRATMWMTCFHLLSTYIQQS